MFFINDLYLLLPEMYLISTFLSLIWLSVTFSIYNISIGRLLSLQIGVLTFLIIIFILVMYIDLFGLSYSLFGNSLNVTEITQIFLFFILFGINMIIIISYFYLKINGLALFEFYLILLLILVGAILLLYSNDLLTLYMGIELQSLGLYILATLKQNSIYATEAGLKYFVLGAFSSCILILGISIIYSFTGLITFSEIYLYLLNFLYAEQYYQGLILGLVFIIVSLLFKIGAAPFHIWLPDVYEGVATLITLFFALIPKFIIFNIILKICIILNQCFVTEFSVLFLASSFFSILIGSIGALYQKTIKRVLSYSAIAHTGFIILVMSLGTIHGFASFLFYIIVYFTLTLNVFLIILQIQQKNGFGSLKYVNNFSFIYKTNKILGLNFVIVLFSIAGIPPFSGFFSKLFVFFAILQQNYIYVALYTIFLSVIGSVYYLKIIRNIMITKEIKKYFLLYDVTTIGSFIIMYAMSINLFFLFCSHELYCYCLNLGISIIV